MRGRPLWAARIAAWINPGHLVWLKDCFGETYLSIARERVCPWDGPKLWAPVYWFTGTGGTELLPDGTARGPSRYIEKWRYVDEPPQGSAIPHRESAA